MGAKKRKPGKARQRQGVSGNPALRAEQVGPGPGAGAFGGLDFGPEDEAAREEAMNGLLELARTMAGGPEPADWWAWSHERVLERARAADWPSDPLGVEETTCAIIGQQITENTAKHTGGHHFKAWVTALASYTGQALRDGLASDGDGGDQDWRPLWALLRGLLLTVPRATTSGSGRKAFPDIKYPYETAVAEAEKTAAELAAAGLLTDGDPAGWPVPEAQPAGAPLVTRDSYGSRFLIVAPFGYPGASGVSGSSGASGSSGEADHWYAWDVDMCWIDTVAAARTFGSETEALAEWRSAAGPSAAAAELRACEPELAGWLLRSCLRGGLFGDMTQGHEPEELLREVFRTRRRAEILARAGLAGSDGADSGRAGSGTGLFWAGDYKGRSRKIRNEFRAWHAQRYGRRVAEVPQAAETIIDEWGPNNPFDERSFFACSPHRIEQCSVLIGDGFREEYAARAFRVLPDWVRWCAERSGISAAEAERSVAVARELSELAAKEGPHAVVKRGDQENQPFRWTE